MTTNQQEPGVSGKKASGKTWVNREELKEQQDFRDDLEESVEGYQSTGQNLFGRTDLDDQNPHQKIHNITEEQLFEALRRSPQVDASGIKVILEDRGIVRLQGIVEDVNEMRMAENVIKNVEGVRKVISELKSKHDEHKV